MNKLIKLIKCKFDYHKYYLIQELTLTLRKIGCKNCGNCFAMNDDAQSVLPWDRDFEEFYKFIGVL